MDNPIQQVTDFEKELVQLDNRLSIVVNPNRPGMANILLQGNNLCSIPYPIIKENPDPTFTITFPNGYVCKHRSKTEAMSLVNDTLEKLKDPEFYKVFFDQE